jgi:hypothetical protein
MTAWLAEVLKAEGCRVAEQAGWQTRGRSGAYAPFGVLNHHTATPTSYARPAPTLNLCINGRSDLPGPLCQVMIGYDGVCYLIAAGRANHAGSARNSPPIPAGDGNAMMVGFEWDYDGTQKPSPEQYQAAVLANAAVLRRMGRNASYAKGHRETSTQGKPDPGQVDLDKLRADIAARLGGGPSAPSTPDKEPEPEPTWEEAMPAAVVYEGRQNVFYINGKGQLIHRWSDPGKPWSAATFTDALLPNSSPELVLVGEQLNLWALRQDGQLFHGWINPGQRWSMEVM